ncbi:hypothetical protein IH799_06770 [candidate division KSB1 bacterium]|nr:hypothetical protein [candidate division KSB1 bacterium]
MDDVVVALDRRVEHAFETGVFAVDRRQLDRLETAGAIVDAGLDCNLGHLLVTKVLFEMSEAVQCSIITFLPGDRLRIGGRVRVEFRVLLLAQEVELAGNQFV